MVVHEIERVGTVQGVRETAGGGFVVPLDVEIVRDRALIVVHLPGDEVFLDRDAAFGLIRHLTEARRKVSP